VTDLAIQALSRVNTDCKSYYKTGLYARFLRINDEWGLKIYEKDGVRDEVFTNQKRAAEHGLAPQVGDKFSFSFPNRLEYYGYTTGCITNTWGDRFALENYGSCFADLSQNKKYDIEHALEDDGEYLSLIEELDEIDIYTGDMHCSNVGYLPGGKLVAIDFY
jgi:hypothetical protein